ncbi:GNAT family N-acetyltransferase [Candidatus Lokiarchaeum ossiferum]|uniref:GNAT family N-acetyltransferase n=1 Tax=Candidatus Lokiarchaeum ossiferum TaxID=2951803 RepID=UPI00352F01E0
MTLQRITEFDKKTLLTFFKPLEFTIAVEALLNGTSEGALWIDDPTLPTIALLWDFADGVYLVSKEYSEPLCKTIQKLFQDQIIPDAEKRSKSPVFVIYTSSDKWNKSIISFFTSKWTIKPEVACFFERPLTLSDPMKSSESLPAPFMGHPMDSKLFKNSDLKHILDLQEEIESDWGSLEKFLTRGYGYCVIDENTNSLASWAIIGNIARSCAELGIDTVEEYWRKGLATHVANQTISLSYKKNLTPHWYCFQNNTTSVKLAEKVGFQKIQEFLVYVIEKKE